jgi:hypothetical protein
VLRRNPLVEAEEKAGQEYRLADFDQKSEVRNQMNVNKEAICVGNGSGDDRNWPFRITLG